MTPQLIYKNYRCWIAGKGEARVIGLAEYVDGKRGAPGQFMAIVHMRGQPPEKYDTDSFESAVAMVAKAFDEPEDSVREALKSSIPKSERRPIEELLANRSPTGLKALTQRIGTAWNKTLRKVFDPS
jgi:hypothetical protein